MKNLSSSNSFAGHAVMLVNNPCVNDSRVIKSAEALVNGGWNVTVVCRQHGELPITEELRGVTYHRLSPVPKDFGSLSSRLKSFFFPKSETKPVKSPATSKPPSLESKILHNLSSNNEKKIKRIISTFRSWILIFKKKLYFLYKVKKKIKHLLILAAKSIYWFHETDEFKNIAFKYVLSLKPDVVHCHDLATLPAGAAIANSYKCKLVYDSHELEMHRNATYPKPVLRKRRKLEKSGIVQTDAVITVSESIADHLKHDYKISRPYVVMNAPDFDGHTTSKNLREDIGLTSETPLAVYVGSVTINRGIDYVVRSLKHNPSLHFATVGPRRPSTELEIHELATKLGVRDRVHFVEPVPPNDVVGYIRTADVSVLPIQNVCLSYYYCMPNKLLESVFAGIPVAVANLVEMRRFVEAYKCGVVMDETDPKSIATAISSIITARQDYILPEGTRLQLAHKYSWATQSSYLRKIYLNLGKA